MHPYIEMFTAPDDFIIEYGARMVGPSGVRSTGIFHPRFPGFINYS